MEFNSTERNELDYIQKTKREAIQIQVNEQTKLLSRLGRFLEEGFENQSDQLVLNSQNELVNIITGRRRRNSASSNNIKQ